MIRPHPRRFALVALLAGLQALASTAARSLPPEQAQNPGTAIVTVDFRALARDGTPVLDLKPEEVVLKVGGRTREIVALELMRAGERAPSGLAGAADAPPAPFATNAPLSSGRTVMFVVDEEAAVPGQEGPGQEALRQLVAALAPEDRIGLMTPKAGGPSVSPSARHDRVLAAVSELKGRGAPTETPAEAVCRTRLVQGTLLNLFESAAPSVPTAVVLVSNGLTAPTTSQLAAVGSSRAGTGSGQAGQCEFSSGDLEALSTAAAVSRVHFFGLEIFRGAAGASAGMEHFASLTGNAMVKLVGDTRGPMQRIARETSAYYLAAFEAPEQERTGASQRVSVTVAREGVEINARPTVSVPKLYAKGAKADKPKVRDMLSGAKVFRDVPLRVSAHTSRAVADGKLRVICVFESEDPAVKLTEASVALFDGTGKPRAQWTGPPAELKRSPVVAAFSAPPPGTYRMRVAVIDAAGAGGTVDEEVNVEAPSAGTAQALAMVLGTQAGGSFAPRLLFVDEPVAMAMVEVYGAPKAADVSAAFEFAASAEGPALASRPGEIRTLRDDLRIAYFTIPIERMPQGDVVVRAAITVDGQPLAAKPLRTLRKVVR